MKLSDFDYHLPPELIAQEPASPRDHSRLMILDRSSKEVTHDYFYNLTKYLRPDDLLVFNQTKVIPARLYGTKETGGKVEVLLLPNQGQFNFIGRNIGRAKKILFDNGLIGKITESTIKFNCDYADVLAKLSDIGHTPLPPYIHAGEWLSEPKLRQMYQTIYAKDQGSVAAPTAGLHFTKELLEKIPNKAYVTLHVGLGTFLPVKTENILDHKMHSEYFEIEGAEAQRIKGAKGRVIAVGTTSVRVLESDWDKHETNIFIYPGYKFKHVDAMITNFHQPKSTLMMLVSAFAGRELIMKAYQEAVDKKYRFHSFGDAMLII